MMLSVLKVSISEYLLNLGNGKGLALSWKRALQAVEGKHRKTILNYSYLGKTTSIYAI